MLFSSEAGPSTGVASDGLSQTQQQIVDDLVQDMGFERKKSEFVIRSLGDCEDIEVMPCHAATHSS